MTDQENLGMTMQEFREAEAIPEIITQLDLLGESAIVSAKGFADLAMSLKDATLKQIASTLIGMLDPKSDAYIEAVVAIGTEFGLLDEKSIAWAKSLPTMAGLINDMVLPANQAGHEAEPHGGTCLCHT